MRPEFSSSADFNQTLVVSVFLHLLFIVILMFLPKPKIPKKVILPAFNVEMIEIPSGKSAGSETATQEKKEVVKPEPAPVPKPAEPELAKAPKAMEAPKPAPQKKTPPPAVKKPEIADKILKELEQLGGKPSPPLKKKAVEELDQLARLKPPAAPRSRAEKTPPVLKETFRELEEMKARKAEAQRPAAVVPPAVVEDVLRGFDSLKMKDSAQTAKQKPDEKRSAKKEELALDELEFNALASKSAVSEKDSKEKSAADLLKELESAVELRSVKPVTPAKEKTPETPPKQIDISVSSGQKESRQFTSQLRKLETPAAEKQPAKQKEGRSEGKPAEGVQRQASVSQAKPGPLAADLLSLYVGAIREKILSNWKSPLGAEHNEVVVSFYIYPQGNIGKPFVDKTAGEEQLDTLAVRAILDSEPFPKFPADLKEPNLHITIRFKYIYQHE